MRLEKQRQQCNKIDRLKTENGKYLISDREILNEASSFYTSLYSSRKLSPEQLNKYLNETKLNNVLSDDAKAACEGKVTLEECTDAVNKLKMNKSPGIDGLTAEFYAAFWDTVGPILTSRDTTGVPRHVCKSPPIQIM